MFTGTLERAIIETLAYSDVFEFPLRLEEIHRYLPVRAEREEILDALHSLGEQVGAKNGFYFLTGRETIVEVRAAREAYSRAVLPSALRYGRMLGALPFIRMVALTGSLAVQNSAHEADFDYMLVTAPKRVWTARAFALGLNRFTRLFGHTLCPNIIVSENALAWTNHDLYTAREFCQMVPITGATVYARLMRANAWVREFLPNADILPAGVDAKAAGLQTILETPLRGALGDRFEHWEMRRKVARFSMQAGFGEETVFSAEMCQGNFDRHRQHTKESLRSKLSTLGINR